MSSRELNSVPPKASTSLERITKLFRRTKSSKAIITSSTNSAERLGASAIVPAPESEVLSTNPALLNDLTGTTTDNASVNVYDRYNWCTTEHASLPTHVLRQEISLNDRNEMDTEGQARSKIRGDEYGGDALAFVEPNALYRSRADIRQTEESRIENFIPCPADPDSLRALQRHHKAIELLKRTLKDRRNDWGSFEFPEIGALSETLDSTALRNEINKVLDARKGSIKNPSTWSKTKAVVEQMFTALTPFAKNFLAVASNVQSVAERELGLKADVEKTLDFIYRQLGQLQVIKDLPKHGVPSAAVVNSALDVKSATLIYISVHLRHECNRLGIGGDHEREASHLELGRVVQDFNSALYQFGHRIGFLTFECVQEIRAALNVVNALIETSASSSITPSKVMKHFMMPYDKNEQFIGRRVLLQSVRSMLCEDISGEWNHRVALYGMGGVGKTQTAIAYVYTYLASYDAVFWISATDEASILSGFQEIAHRTGCIPIAGLDPTKVAKMVLAWLRQNENWLVVIDNLDHIELAKDYLPDRAQRKHTLITTRNPNAVGIPARGLEVHLPDRDESVELLYSLSGMSLEFEFGEAERIVDELGYLPLAIDQAASYVRLVTRSFSTFLGDYRDRRMELHKWVSEGNRQYTHSIANMWFISFDLIEKDQPQTAKLFQVFSFLNPDMILLEFITFARDAFDDDLREIVSDSLKFVKALLCLEKFSLIKWSRETSSVSMHRLLQSVVRDAMVEKQSLHCMSTVVKMSEILFLKEVTDETLALCRRYQSQLVRPLLNVGALRNCRTAEMSLHLAEFLSGDGKYEESEQLFAQAVQIYTELKGRGDRALLKAKTGLAQNYGRRGRYEEAAKLQQATLRTCTEELGENDLDTLTVTTQLATIYRLQGRFPKAIQLLETTVAAMKRLLGEDHLETLCTMCSLALTYKDQGRWMEAAELQEKVVSVRKELLGSSHLETMREMGNLALTYKEQGRWTEATNLQEKALDVMRNILGEDHRDTLRALGNLSVYYGDQGRWSEAAEFQEKALNVRKRVLGEDHPETLAAMGNLGVIYRHLRLWPQANELLKKTLLEETRLLGEEHPDVLNAMINLGATYTDQGMLAEAMELQQRAMFGIKRVLGDEHKSLAEVISDLGLTYMHQGRYEEAASLHETALAIRNRISGNNHPRTLETMYRLAENYLHQNRLQDAVQLQQKTVYSMIENLGERHPSTLKAIESLKVIKELR